MRALEDDAMGCDEIAEMEAYRSVIEENISYDTLLHDYPQSKEALEGIVNLIVETVTTDRSTVLIASRTFPARVVKNRFMKLNAEHIRYVLDSLAANTTKVKNIRKYLLAVLFNAPSTISSYYQAEVNHDLSEGTDGNSAG